MNDSIQKDKLIKEMAEELAYLQINADWWHYVSNIKEKQDMSNKQLEYVYELRCICDKLGILEQVYDAAYEIYDFRNSGKKDFVPNVELIKKLYTEFCEPIKKKRLVF